MAERDRPIFGHAVVSWETVRNDVTCAYEEPPTHDGLASGMHRLRGLVMAQGAETEAVLREIVSFLDRTVDVRRRTAGMLLRDVRRLLGSDGVARWNETLSVLAGAIDRRNHAVHSPVEIGSSWMDYRTGGGEWVAVISTMGGEVYDEVDLERDLALQQEAMIMAVDLLVALSTRSG